MLSWAKGYRVGTGQRTWHSFLTPAQTPTRLSHYGAGRRRRAGGGGNLLGTIPTPPVPRATSLWSTSTTAVATFIAMINASARALLLEVHPPRPEFTQTAV